MSPATIGIIGIGILLLAFIIRIPIACAMISGRSKLLPYGVYAFADVHRDDV